MKEYFFPYYIKFGKNDSTESDLACSLSNKDAIRLENSAKEGGRFHLDEDDEIEDIYDKVYNKVIQAERENLLSNPDIIKDWISWDDDFDPEETIDSIDIDRYLDELTIGINYPKELQMLERTYFPRRRKQNFKSITLDIDDAEEFLALEDNKNKYVVYVDEGKCLYWVPIKYFGAFVVNSDVREVKKFVFEKRESINEIIIENGLETIGECYFTGCRGLEKVTIPGSVKSIGIRAFSKCSELKDVELSEGLEEIHPQAFDNCYSLETITIPSTVKEISSLFGGTGSFKHVYFLGKDTEITGVWAYLWEYSKVLHVLHESGAEKFAIKNKLRYDYID